MLYWNPIEWGGGDPPFKNRLPGFQMWYQPKHWVGSVAIAVQKSLVTTRRAALQITTYEILWSWTLRIRWVCCLCMSLPMLNSVSDWQWYSPGLCFRSSWPPWTWSKLSKAWFIVLEGYVCVCAMLDLIFLPQVIWSGVSNLFNLLQMDPAGRLGFNTTIAWLDGCKFKGPLDLEIFCH